MTLTIELPGNLEMKLQSEASQKGVSVNEYAEQLLKQVLTFAPEPPFWATASKEDWLCAFDALMDSHDSTLPPLSDQAVSRESIYEVRG